MVMVGLYVLRAVKHGHFVHAYRNEYLLPPRFFPVFFFNILLFFFCEYIYEVVRSAGVSSFLSFVSRRFVSACQAAVGLQ